MKTKFNINRIMKRISILAVLLLCAYSVSASPLSVIMGGETNGLDFVYIVLGISAIWILVLYPGHVDSDEELIGETMNVNPNQEHKHFRKVIRKTA